MVKNAIFKVGPLQDGTEQFANKVENENLLNHVCFLIRKRLFKDLQFHLSNAGKGVSSLVLLTEKIF